MEKKSNFPKNLLELLKQITSNPQLKIMGQGKEADRMVPHGDCGHLIHGDKKGGWDFDQPGLVPSREVGTL